jgi:adhesin/invasin
MKKSYLFSLLAATTSINANSLNFDPSPQFNSFGTFRNISSFDPHNPKVNQNAPSVSGLIMGQGLGMRNQDGQSLVDARLLNLGLALKNGTFTETTKSYGLGLVNNKFNSLLSDLLPTLETSIGVNEDREVEFGILGVQPITNYTKESKDVVLYQGIFFISNSERYTVNNGVVYRKITGDEKFIYGVNIFYDHEFPIGHKRMSLGGEFKSTMLDVNINHYMPLSDWRNGVNDVAEKAQTGTTLELVTPIPYLPRLNASVMYSKWESSFGLSDANSITFGIHGAIYAGLGFEFKRRISDQLGNVSSGMLIYTFRGNNKDFTKPFFSSQAYIKDSMRERMLEKVRRENIIRSEVDGLQIEVR